MEPLDAETIQAVDGFLLMLARCKTQEERRQLVVKFARIMARVIEQRLQDKAQAK